MMAPDPCEEWDEWTCDCYQEWLRFFRLDYSSWYEIDSNKSKWTPPSLEDFIREFWEECGRPGLEAATEAATWAPAAPEVTAQLVAARMAVTRAAVAMVAAGTVVVCRALVETLAAEMAQAAAEGEEREVVARAAEAMVVEALAMAKTAE